MKMAKASKADLDMAMSLCHALEAIGHQFVPMMPEAIARNDDGERFNIDDGEHCQRVLEHLLETLNKGSLFRVVYGMGVLLNPANRIVDPNADTLEHHPAVVAALNAFNYLKPLFIPLRAKFYDAFLDGSKGEELRSYGPRWNEKTCIVGRGVILSKGYGNQHRATGTIWKFKKQHGSTFGSTYQHSIIDIYGTLDVWIACISINVDGVELKAA